MGLGIRMLRALVLLLDVAGAQVLATGKSAGTETDIKYALIGTALGIAILAGFLALKICMIRKHLFDNDSSDLRSTNMGFNDTISLKKRTPRDHRERGAISAAGPGHSPQGGRLLFGQGPENAELEQLTVVRVLLRVPVLLPGPVLLLLHIQRQGCCPAKHVRLLYPREDRAGRGRGLGDRQWLRAGQQAAPHPRSRVYQEAEAERLLL
ncbi:transmembrane protein 273 isoform X2 [Camelus dromedarius]|uniref:transmembrane protein 273 isoform X2 n=1 Tax=Camelus dromedarius TaxID=9838 RepID=UPI003119BF2B